MQKDRRYTTVKILIERGYITKFDEIFEHIPISIVAKDYGSNYVRLKWKISKPLTFKLIDIKILSGVFGIELHKMIELILQTKDNRLNNGK